MISYSIGDDAFLEECNLRIKKEYSKFGTYENGTFKFGGLGVKQIKR